ncbi:yeats domain-containing protein 2 [Lichtheimia corymbifera JMRC:FSU:9682]|uniref:Yeats domain-containing protein 2 n=1 Tax=Lichtheimia corymbifera JMRC:FSU:9682 TaxID=1263082 RepID=A0A068RK35_9FUNG|nr:yeats domain-containing protein 2 [Lichtheimia corymbifera JMRC:FSU:9682]
MRSIDDLPKDDATRKKITDIIDRQFNLEIYLKHRETAAIRREIEKAEDTLRDLEQAINNENAAGSTTDTSSPYTRRSAAMVANAMFQAYLPTPAERKAERQRHQGALFGRRSDGVFVRLSCPECKRDDFGNQIGFLNHCRLAHGLEFGPYEQIMQRCGTPVDESEVPPDHPVRLRPFTRPVPAVPMKRKERPTIKVFEEDVDLESERVAQEQQQHIEREGKRPMQSSKSIPETTESTPPQPQPPLETTATVTTTSSSENEQPSEQDQKPPEQPMESFAAAVVPTTAIDDVGSRFYIKRQIIVGNVSKFIPPEKRDPTLKNYTHKWMVYVVEPPQMQEVSKFVTGVRFFLHPSYKPLDVVDVTEPPFRLTRLGWGEFPIRVQLFFVDKRRNKSVDIIHHVKLDHSHSGKQMLGGERVVEIELDRNTDFEDKSNVPRNQPTPTHTPSSESSMTPAPIVNVHKQKMTLLHGLLKDTVRRLPIIRPASQTTTAPLPYTCATSTHAYFSWSVGRRKALEWHRAHLMRIQVQQQAFDTMDDILRSAASSLTTKQVVLWCREHRYTPQRSDIDAKEEEKAATTQTETGFGYCKFCGCLRDRHGTDDSNCRWRPKGWATVKKRGLSTLSSVDTLMDQLPQGWDRVSEADEDMDVDIDVTPTTTTANTAGASIIKTISEMVADEATDEQQLDWVWSVIGQLRLRGVVANDIVADREGNLRGPHRDFDLAAAMEQRVYTGNLISQLVRVFLKRMLHAGIDIYNRQQQQENQPKDKLLVPLHIYEGLRSVPQFDFLTNQYMGPSSSSSSSPDNQEHN